MNKPILVIKLGALGDLVQSFEAFHAIRTHHAGDPVILLTTRPFEALGRACPWFDEVWIDQRPGLKRPLAWFRLIRRLRGAGFSRVYDLQSNQRTAWYFRLLGRRPPQWSGAVAGCSHPRPDFLAQSGHNRDRLLNHVRSAGVAVGEAAIGPADLSWLDADPGRFRLPERFVVMVPGCSPHRPYKRWPAERYAELAGRLGRRGIASVVIGTAADRDAVATIRAVAPAVVDLCGQTSLVDIGGIGRAALGAVGNDTGPIFILSVVGTPTLMLMSGHTIAERMAPLGPRVAWLQREHLDTLAVEEVEAGLLFRGGHD
ncbi:MAG: ADP-heptose--LPS heptosyltransferase [Azospirillum sp.]|nr:ADP-heptose--LPS heptosyltransferase [Azospirillum sp.]